MRIEEAEAWLATTRQPSCAWCQGESRKVPFPMSSFDADEHEAWCTPKDMARAALPLSMLGPHPSGLDTFAALVLATKALKAEEALGQHFARCSYELSGCETSTEDDGFAVFCKEYRRLAEAAAASRREGLVAWEAL